MINFFKNLFGQKPADSAGVSAKPLAKTPSADPAKDPNLIKVFDAYGRELFITRDEWRKNILPDNLRKSWDNPDSLYQGIVMALQDGFDADVIEASRRLLAIDTDAVRGACLFGVVLQRNKRLDEAEKVFRDHIAKHGESGIILTNLAKVFSDRKNDSEAEKILRHGLDLDPNQDNALPWYAAIHNERGCEPAMTAALRDIARHPKSWRPQMYLAKPAITAGRLDEARALYAEALDRAGSPTPADLLMTISGDLGNAGKLTELLEIVEPRFDINAHGLMVGNNLIKANLDLGRFDRASELLKRLVSLNRPDWREHLTFWDTTIATARLAATKPLDTETIRLSLGQIDGPVWLPPASPAAELFPRPTGDIPHVVIFVASMKTPGSAEPGKATLADAPGRISRAMPLLLAERLFFRLPANVCTIVPRVESPSPGFAVFPNPWEDAKAAATATRCDANAGHAVTFHLDATGDTWTITARVLDARAALLLAEHTVNFAKAYPGPALLDLADRITNDLAGRTGRTAIAAPADYRIPETAWQTDYCVRLEQLLAVRLTASDGQSLSAPTEILNGMINLCVETPKLLTTRLLLARTLTGMHRARPEIPPLYREKIQKLQADFPLPSPAQEVCERQFNEALSA